jgi:catalase
VSELPRPTNRDLTQAEANARDSNDGELHFGFEDIANFADPFYRGKIVYRSLNVDQKTRLADNIGEDAVNCSPEVQKKLLEYLFQIDPELSGAVQAFILRKPVDYGVGIQ